MSYDGLNVRKFDGKIIYATPGSGKTYLAEHYDYVIDGDEVFLELMDEYFPEFDKRTNCHPGINILRFYKYSPSKYQRLLRLARDRFLQYKENQDYIVLIGTVKLMHLADLVYAQTNPSINANRNFNQQNEENQIEQLLENGTLERHQIKSMNNYLEEYLKEY